jgi:superfamily I DNA/RNA helicase
LFNNRDGEKALTERLAVCREAFLDEMIEKEPGLADEKDVLEDLLQKCSEGELLADYTVEIFGNQGKSPDQINLMTLHASKGLEFQTVVMIGLEEGVFPNGYDLENDDSFREASRLFYVGITRAKNQVHLLYNQNESRFITGIKKDI